MNLPIIEVQIKGIRESFCAALHTHNEEFNQMVKDAVNKSFNIEAIQHKIDTQIAKAIDDTIDSLGNQCEVQEIIKDIVVKSLINKRDEIERKNEL
jgi:hypothetical protein